MASRTGRKQFTDKESSFSFSSNSNHYSPRPMFNRSRHMNSRVSLDAKRHRTLRTIFFLILLGGVSMLFLQNSHVANSYKTTSRLRKGSFLSPQQELDQFPSFNQDEAAIASDHLIIVAGHSVITSTFLSAERGYNNARDWFSSEDAWFLLDYQKKQVRFKLRDNWIESNLTRHIEFLGITECDSWTYRNRYSTRAS